VKATQPVGDLYIASLPYRVLCTIADFDVRRVLQEDRDVERYLGIQRPLSKKRVAEIEDYVNFADACFPGSIIIAVDERVAEFDPKTSQMTLRNIQDDADPVLARRIARVIDGQHRIAGLYKFRGKEFDCPVTILIGMDIADQAQIFARVNLTQTKVNPSLAYDLFELAETRSPQKTAHEITVKLDRQPDGPFEQRIKRLGIATPGRTGETLAQATVVKGILQHISSQPDKDRDQLMRGLALIEPTQAEAERHVFRPWFVRGNDEAIFVTIRDYFEAVGERWPDAWNATGQGYILSRTNGYLALMRFLRDAVLYWGSPGHRIDRSKFLTLLQKVRLKDDELTTVNFEPGTGGEARLYRAIKEQALG
jgi:DGQHR domain-containing protein